MTSSCLPLPPEKEQALYAMARQSLDDAIGRDEVLFDAMRAATLIAVWLLSRADYVVVRVPI
jgi:hypothetical protein